MRKKEKLKILYEDSSIIVIDKPAGLLSVSTLTEKENTLFYKVASYLKKKNKNNKLFVVHRLDRDTSGLILFAKSEKIKRQLQDHWDFYVQCRQYVALVEGLALPSKVLRSYLAEDGAFRVYVTKNKQQGKLAVTKYRRIASFQNYSLLEIEIETGRKNQIRVQLSEDQLPIAGDSKYGAKTNPLHRLALHANRLVVVHPVTKQTLTLESEIPLEFVRFLRQ